MTKACSPVTPRRSPRLSGAAHDDEPPTTVLALLLACGDRAALHAVLACLSAQCLATARCVCAKLNVAGAAHDLWASHCLADWADKVHVAPSARSQLEEGRGAAAFAAARADAVRSVLTHEELVNLAWRFRFKRDAGVDWQEHDPFWRGLLPTRVIFRDDGTVTRRPDPDAPEDPGPTLPVNVDITWRFVCQGAGVAGPAGAFVRCRVAGRSVPTYVVSRHASNWGWIMQSCWALYTSFPMPKQGEAGGKLDDDSLAVNINAQEAEAVAYNTGLPLDEDDFADAFDTGFSRAVVGSSPVVEAGSSVAAAAVADPTVCVVRVRGAPGQVAVLPRGRITALMLANGLGVPAMRLPAR